MSHPTLLDILTDGSIVLLLGSYTTTGAAMPDYTDHFAADDCIATVLGTSGTATVPTKLQDPFLEKQAHTMVWY